jgi:hypothetical protein
MPGDYPTARTAFEAERAALLGTRSFYTPYAERLSGLDRRISRLLAAAEENSVQTTFEERAQWLVERDSWSDWAYSWFAFAWRSLADFGNFHFCYK